MSESVQNVCTADRLKWLKFWMSFAKALVTYLPGPIIFPDLKHFPLFLCAQFCEQE